MQHDVHCDQLPHRHQAAGGNCGSDEGVLAPSQTPPPRATPVALNTVRTMDPYMTTPAERFRAPRLPCRARLNHHQLRWHWEIL